MDRQGTDSSRRDPLIRSISVAVSHPSSHPSPPSTSNSQANSNNSLKPLTSMSQEDELSETSGSMNRRSSYTSTSSASTSTSSKPTKKTKSTSKSKSRRSSSQASSNSTPTEDPTQSDDFALDTQTSSSELDTAQSLEFKEKGDRLIDEMNDQEDIRALGHSKSKASSEPNRESRSLLGGLGMSSSITPIKSSTLNRSISTSNTPSSSKTRPSKLIRHETERVSSGSGSSSRRRRRSGSASGSSGRHSRGGSSTTPSTPIWGSLWGLAGWLDPSGNEIERELEEARRKEDAKEERREQRREERRRKRREDRERRREDEDEELENEGNQGRDGRSFNSTEMSRQSSASISEISSPSSSSSSSSKRKSDQKSKRSSRRSSSQGNQDEGGNEIQDTSLSSSTSSLKNLFSNTPDKSEDEPLRTPEMLSEHELENVVEFEVEPLNYEESGNGDSNPSTPLISTLNYLPDSSTENTPSSNSVSPFDSSNYSSSNNSYSNKNLKSLRLASKQSNVGPDCHSDLNPLTPPPPLLPRDLRGDYFGDYSHGDELDFSSPLIERKKSFGKGKGREEVGLGINRNQIGAGQYGLNGIANGSEMKRSSSKVSTSNSSSSPTTPTETSTSTSTSNSNSASNSGVSTPIEENSPGKINGAAGGGKSKKGKKGKGKGKSKGKGKGRRNSKKKEDVELAQEEDKGPVSEKSDKDEEKLETEVQSIAAPHLGQEQETENERTPRPSSIQSFESNSETPSSLFSDVRDDGSSVSSYPASISSASNLSDEKAQLGNGVLSSSEQGNEESTRKSNSILKRIILNFGRGILLVLTAPVYGPMFVIKWVGRRFKRKGGKRVQIQVSNGSQKESKATESPSKAINSGKEKSSFSVSKRSSSLIFKEAEKDQESKRNASGVEDEKKGGIHSLKPPTPKPEKQEFLDNSQASEKMKSSNGDSDERDKREVSAELNTQDQVSLSTASSPDPTPSPSPKKSKLLPNPHSVDPMLIKEPKARRVGQPGGILDVSQEIGSAIFMNGDEEDLAVLKAEELISERENLRKERERKMKGLGEEKENQRLKSIEEERKKVANEVKNETAMIRKPNNNRISKFNGSDQINVTRVIGTGYLNSTSIPRGPASTIIHHSPKVLVLDLDETLIHSTSRSPTWGVLRSTNTRAHDPKGAGVDTGSSLLGFGNLSLLSLGLGSAGRPGRVRPHMVEVVIGGRSVIYHVYKRPWVDYFLRKVSVNRREKSFDLSLVADFLSFFPFSILQVASWYHVVIFTASVQEYGDPVIDWLDQGRGLIAGRLFRDVSPIFRIQQSLFC